MEINDLFSIPVASFNLNRNCTNQELQYLKSLPQRQNSGNTTSIDYYILKNEKMSSLNHFFMKSVEEYFQRIFNPKFNLKIYITQCWVNYTASEQYHHRHRHPNSIVSGVFYVETNNDKIYFGNDRTNHIIKIYPKEWNIYNSDSWWLEAVQNQLIIFPSWLEHWVESDKRNDRVRISISFNTFVSGILGDGESLTELNINDNSYMYEIDKIK